MNSHQNSQYIFFICDINISNIKIKFGNIILMKNNILLKII